MKRYCYQLESPVLVTLLSLGHAKYMYVYCTLVTDVESQ